MTTTRSNDKTKKCSPEWITSSSLWCWPTAPHLISECATRIATFQRRHSIASVRQKRAHVSFKKAADSMIVWRLCRWWGFCKIVASRLLVILWRGWRWLVMMWWCSVFERRIGEWHNVPLCVCVYWCSSRASVDVCHTYMVCVTYMFVRTLTLHRRRRRCRRMSSYIPFAHFTMTRAPHEHNDAAFAGTPYTHYSICTYKMYGFPHTAFFISRCKPSTCLGAGRWWRVRWRHADMRADILACGHSSRQTHSETRTNAHRMDLWSPGHFVCVRVHVTHCTLEVANNTSMRKCTHNIW